MAVKYVILHDVMGIFLGQYMGMAFWSKIEDAGQYRAVVWDSPQDALGFMARWRPRVEDPARFRIEPVESLDDDYATIPELVKAGLGPWVGLMMKNLPVEGRA